MRRIGNWGISFLDKHLTGICTGDLIMFGASTGSGKTTLSNMLSLNSSRQGIKTVVFSLENAKGDFLKQNVFSLFKKTNPTNIQNYREFITDFSINPQKYDSLVSKIESDAYRMEDKDGSPMLVLFESSDGISDLETLLKTIRDYVRQGYEFFIIDHIDHLSNDQAKDLQYIRQAMKDLANLAFNEDVCIMTYSQIRKDLSSDCMVPGVYDLKGGSQKSDIASIVITMARFPYFDNKEVGIYTSLMAIRKDRYGHTAMGRLEWKDGLYLPMYKEIYEFDANGYMVDGATKKQWIKATEQEE